MLKLRSPFIVERLSVICILSIFACKPDESETEPKKENPADTITVADLDTYSDHLQFLGATKKPGKSPVPSGNSSLKISLQDTLYLMDEVKRPIKFLHEDTTKNVAGVYIQVQGMGGGGSLATYFYDVPEIREMADNDSVSVVLVGVDPDGLEDLLGVPPAGAPFIFDVTITPYGENGQPLGQTTLPVSVPELNDDPKGPTVPGECGLVTAPEDFWEWQMSFRPKKNPQPGEDYFSFYSDPYKVFGAGGQNINGCCTDGVSFYDFICAGNKAAQRPLHFRTFYQIQAESLTFFDNGSYLRQLFEKVANPAPDESDFCGSGPGVVKNKINHTLTHGNWIVNQTTVPENLRAFYDSRNYLFLQGKSSTGVGFGNSGGFVHQLTCKYLVLIQPDGEGFGQPLFMFYDRKSTSDPDWYAM